MASSWSALKIELLETGANSGSWGTLTNANLGDAVLGEAITGSATVDFASDADVTITLTDVATTQAARNLRLNITESSTGIGSVRNLILGSGCQIEKFYLINNTGTGAKTVKNTSGTGITVPAGKATLVYNNGTNVVDAASYFTSLTLGSALPVASGGTGITSFGSGVATFLGTPSSANLAAALTDETGSGSAVFSTSPTLVTPNLGTPSTLVLTSATGLPLSSGVTGTLPIANGGTGSTSTTFVDAATNVTGILPVANGGTATATPSLIQGSGVTITGTWPNQTINATGTGGTVTAVSVASANGLAGTSSGGATPALTLSTSITGVLKGNGTAISAATAGTDYVAPGGALGTPASGTATNLTGLSLTTGVTGTLPIANGGTGTTSTTFVDAATNVTGTLPVANGGTGASTLTSNNVLLGNGTSAVQFIAPGSTGNVLTSDGSTWASTPPAGIPVGGELMWPTNTVPTGFLQENGASLSRTGTYAALFAVIGTTYGTANGSSFNLPDSRARFVRVWANGSALDPNAGSRTIPATAGATMTAGDNVGTNQAEDFLSHRHNVPGAIASAGSGTGGAVRLTYDNGDFYSGYVGGSETRPVNTYRMMIIKY